MAVVGSSFLFEKTFVEVLRLVRDELRDLLFSKEAVSGKVKPQSEAFDMFRFCFLYVCSMLSVVCLPVVKNL